MSKPSYRIPQPQRLRRITTSFAWIDHRLVRNGYLAVMTQQDQSLYLFLALAADRHGVSFYRKEKICDLLGLDFSAFQVARDRLITLGLLAFAPYIALTVNGFYQLRGDEEGFTRQLDLLADLRSALRRRVPMISTIFNAWAVLRHLIRPPTEHLPPVMDAAADGPSRRILQMHATGPDAVRAALATIADNLARFASRCIDAGADGIFLSVRDDWVDAPGSAPLYPHLVRPTDLAILAGASRATFNMLHVCGKAVDFAAMARYPVHAINWADRAAGPSIATAASFARTALCGGVDNLWTLPTGTPADVEREVADAIAQAGDRPLLIAPGCTYDPAKVPEVNLRALARAARQIGERG